MNGEQIIAKFELTMDDSSELSTTEELSLLDDCYKEVLADRPWEFLKKEWTATTDGNNYLDLPADFMYLIANGNYTDNQVMTDSNSNNIKIKVGNSYYQLINWQDRKQYVNNQGYAYIDSVNNKLYFTDTPAAGLSVSADYIYAPDSITLSTSPVFPAQFHKVLVYKMVVNSFMIQLFPKNRAYIQEYAKMADNAMADLAFYNANLIV